MGLALGSRHVFDQSPMNFLGWCAENLHYGIWLKQGFESYVVSSFTLKNWELQQDEALLDSRCGISLDYVELQRAYFDYNGIESRSFLLESDKQIHAFSMFKILDDWFWFECAESDWMGINKIGRCKDLYQLTCLQWSLFKDKHGEVKSCWEYFKPEEKHVGFSEFFDSLARTGTRFL